MNNQMPGWSAFFARAYEPLQTPSMFPARIIRQERGAWEIQTAQRTALIHHVRSGLAPVVGDWVVVNHTLDSIEAILPRRTMLSRRSAGRTGSEQILAANTDVAFVVMGLDGDFNLRRLERYFALIHVGGARPVVLLNKRDLCVDWPARVAQSRDVALDADVHAISALHDDVPGLLSTCVAAGETAAMLGSSGAGKSTIANRLLGAEAQTTREVREHDSRGRHTTTARRLIAVPQGWFLLDMPGLREVGLIGADEAVSDVFSDIESLAAQCRFRNCTHNGEPGCAVIVDATPGRIESLRKLRWEMRDPLERKREEKRLHRVIRQIDRIRGFSKE